MAIGFDNEVFDSGLFDNAADPSILPKFTDSDGNNGYTFQVLPVIPSDRPDVDIPANRNRALLEYLQAGMLIGTKFLIDKGKWSFTWRAINESVILQFQYFAGLANFRFYPGIPGRYIDVYISNQFNPIWQPGGRYDLTLILREYTPRAVTWGL